MIRRSFITAAGAAAALSPRAALADFNGPTASQVNFAVVVPLTGPFVREGEQIANGVRQAINDSNNFRGPLDKVYGFRTFDDENTIANGILNAQFAVDDTGLVGAIGHLSGKVTDQALQVYARANMGLVVPASTYERVTAHNVANVFRLPTKDSVEGRLGSKYLAAQGAKHIVVVTQDGDYGNDVAQGFAAQANGDKLDARVVTFAWEKPNFQAAARDALASSPDTIYLAGLAPDMGPIVPALRNLNFKGTLAASQGFFAPATIERWGAAVEGIVVSSSMPPLFLAPSDYRIKRDFEARYGTFTPLSAFGYAAAQLLMAAVRRSGGYNRTSVVRAISSGPIDTAVGTFQFDPNGDPVDPNVYFYAVRDGKWTYLKAAHSSGFILK